MKFICERDALKDAIGGVIGRTKGVKIPILTHILIETGQYDITLTAHDLESYSRATIPAEVEDDGSVAMPADRLQQLVGGLSSGCQIAMDLDGRHMKLRAGRASYRFPTLPAREFPDLLKVRNAVAVELKREQLSRLLKTPLPCIATGADRPNLSGIYLHKTETGVAACATDAQVLIRTEVEVDCDDFEGVILPEGACSEIVRIASEGVATLYISETLLGVSSGRREFVTKLIDATYPDYKPIIPEPTAPSVTVMTEEVEALMRRLMTAHDPELMPVVRLEIPVIGGQMGASINTQIGRGEEFIDCEAGERSEPGHIAFQIKNLTRIAANIGSKRMQMFIGGPSDSMRINDPDSSDIVALCLPCR